MQNEAVPYAVTSPRPYATTWKFAAVFFRSNCSGSRESDALLSDVVSEATNLQLVRMQMEEIVEAPSI